MNTRAPAPRGGKGPNRPGGPQDRYGDDGTARLAFVPGILGAVAALVGVAFEVGTGGYTVVHYVVAILALIMIVFVFQARAFLWAVPLAAIAVLWNPVFPIELHGIAWLVIQVVGAAVLVAAGVRIKVPTEDH